MNADYPRLCLRRHVQSSFNGNPQKVLGLLHLHPPATVLIGYCFMILQTTSVNKSIMYVCVCESQQVTYRKSKRGTSLMSFAGRRYSRKLNIGRGVRRRRGKRAMSPHPQVSWEFEAFIFSVRLTASTATGRRSSRHIRHNQVVATVAPMLMHSRSQSRRRRIAILHRQMRRRSPARGRRHLGDHLWAGRRETHRDMRSFPRLRTRGGQQLLGGQMDGRGRVETRRCCAQIGGIL